MAALVDRLRCTPAVGWLVGALSSVSCQQTTPPARDYGPLPPPTAPLVLRLEPGSGTNVVPTYGTYTQARLAFGNPNCPNGACPSMAGLSIVSFPDAKLDVLFGTAGAFVQGSDRILAFSTSAPTVQTPVAIGGSRADAEAVLGKPSEDLQTSLSWARGVSVRLEADKVISVTTFDSYSHQDAPPEMTDAEAPHEHAAETASWPRYTLPGTGGNPGPAVDVVDMHLHPGTFGQLNQGQRLAVARFLPPPLAPFLVPFTNALSDPYAPGLGIVAQAKRAGIAHGVGYAVWTPYTTGWFSNADLEAKLQDPNNTRWPDGRPFLYGFASIFWDNLGDAAVRQKRCAALGSYLSAPDSHILGIKLAHTHQRVRLDDDNTDCVYQLARRYNKPVALHTGKTPSPGALDDPTAYDPKYLEQLVTRYSDVTFVLLHVGQGDRRAVLSALDLAERHANVALELSALGRPTVLDEMGQPSMSMEPQFPFVIAEIKRRNLVSRALFGSDGPQLPGFPAAYLARLVTEMQRQGYSTAELTGFLSGNFYRLFHVQ